MANPWHELLALMVYGPLVVLLHELGHALFASLGGYQVIRFSIGQGPVVLRLGAVGHAAVVVGAWPTGGACTAVPVRPPTRRRLVFHAGGLVAQIALALVLLLSDHWIAASAARFNALVFLFNAVPWRVMESASDGWQLLGLVRGGRGVLEILGQRHTFERLAFGRIGEGSALARAYGRLGLAWIDVVAGRIPDVSREEEDERALSESPYLLALYRWITAEAHRRASRPLAALRTARKRPADTWSEDDVALLRLAEASALVDLGEPLAARRAIASVVGASGIVARQALTVLLAASLEADRDDLEHATWRVVRRADEAWLDPVATSGVLWAAAERLDELGRRAPAEGVREAARMLAERTLRAASPSDRPAVRERLGPAAVAVSRTLRAT